MQHGRQKCAAEPRPPFGCSLCVLQAIERTLIDGARNVVVADIERTDHCDGKDNEAVEEERAGPVVAAHAVPS
eukprot:5578749-Prymnesium_polylepis.2